MSYEARVMALFEEANPVPAEQIMESVAMEPAAYLATLEKRSSDVTQLDDRIEGRSKRPTGGLRRRSTWAFASAFAAVLIVGVVGAMLLTGGGTDGPPFATPREAAQAYAEAVNSGDVEAYESIMADGAIDYLVGPFSDSPDAQPEKSEARLLALAAEPLQISLGSCVDQGEVLATCDVEFTSGIETAIQGGPLRGEMTLGIDSSGLIGLAMTRIDTSEDYMMRFEEFFGPEFCRSVEADCGWLGENHPDLATEWKGIWGTGTELPARAPAEVIPEVVAAVDAFLATAPEEEPPPTTLAGADPAALVGSWSEDTVGVVFGEDTYAFTIDGALVETGTYTTEVDPDVIVFTSGDDSPGCAAGSEGQMFYETNGALTLSPLDDVCGFRTLLSGDIQPLASTEAVDPATLPVGIALTGYWGGAEGTGAVFDANDYTFMVDGEIVDQGTYELLASPYRVALTPSTGECAPATYSFFLNSGDILILEAPEAEECLTRMSIAFRDLPASDIFELPES